MEGNDEAAAVGASDGTGTRGEEPVFIDTFLGTDDELPPLCDIAIFGKREQGGRGGGEWQQTWQRLALCRVALRSDGVSSGHCWGGITHGTHDNMSKV